MGSGVSEVLSYNNNYDVGVYILIATDVGGI